MWSISWFYLCKCYWQSLKHLFRCSYFEFSSWSLFFLMEIFGSENNSKILSSFDNFNLLFHKPVLFIPFYFWFLVPVKFFNFISFQFYSLTLFLSLRHWWPISVKYYIWFISCCIRWCTNFCLNVSTWFSCSYLGWHELWSIDKRVSIFLICSYAALFSNLFMKFSDFMLYQTINFFQAVRKKFWFFNFCRSEK